MRAAIAFLLAAVFLAGCGSGSKETPAQDSSREPLNRYSLHGEVVRLDGQGKIATIRHQKIEGYMEAMTMQFPVKDPAEFAGLHPEDCINATVFVQGFNFWVGEIKHVPSTPGQCVAPPAEQKNNPAKTP